MSDQYPSSKSRSRSRKSKKKSFRPLDLGDLHTALPVPAPPQPRQTPRNALPRQRAMKNNTVPQSHPSAILQRPQQPPAKRTEPSKKQATVTPHPGWGSLNSQMTRPVQQSWSSIEFSQSNLDKLLLLCHSGKELKKEGYVLQQLTRKELFSKMRCIGCHIRRKGKALKFDEPVSQRSIMAKSTARPEPGDPFLKRARYIKEQGEEHAEPTASQPPPAVCVWHSGKILHGGSTKVWSCCRQKLTARGCESNNFHRWEDENNPDTHLPWRFYQIELVYPNSMNPYADPRPAVALDCEMGLAQNNESELIRLTAVDFFTGATLIDQLVVPSVKIKNWNTRYSGVTADQIIKARESGRCYFGRDAAREALLRFVGPETILIMHGGSSDLTALRMIHPYVVDSFIVDTYYGGKVEGGRSLKNLMMLKTGREIQNRGLLGHDSLEDALASRELVIRFMATIPDHEPPVSSTTPDVHDWVARFNDALTNSKNLTTPAPVNATPWYHSFFACLTPIDICAITCCLPCLTFGKTHHRSHKDGELNGYHFVNASCLLFLASSCVGVPCIPALLQRADIRRKYNLQGEFVMDAVGTCCCGCCSLVQMEKEVEYREGLVGGAADVGVNGVVGEGGQGQEGYSKGEEMVYDGK